MFHFHSHFHIKECTSFWFFFFPQELLTVVMLTTPVSPQTEVSLGLLSTIFRQLGTDKNWSDSRYFHGGPFAFQELWCEQHPVLCCHWTQRAALSGTSICAFLRHHSLCRDEQPAEDKKPGCGGNVFGPATKVPLVTNTKPSQTSPEPPGNYLN